MRKAKLLLLACARVPRQRQKTQENGFRCDLIAAAGSPVGWLALQSRAPPGLRRGWPLAKVTLCQFAALQNICLISPPAPRQTMFQTQPTRSQWQSVWHFRDGSCHFDLRNFNYPSHRSTDSIALWLVRHNCYGQCRATSLTPLLLLSLTP